MVTMTPSECLLCRCDIFDELLTFDKPDPYEKAVGISDYGYARSWVRCRQCGFVYSRYSRPPESLDRIYGSSYRGQGAPWRNGNVEQVFDKVTRLPEGESETKFRVKWIKTHLAALQDSGFFSAEDRRKNLLDIGGGNGIFAYEFQDERWKSHVIDPDENGRFIQEKLKIPFFKGQYEPNKIGLKFDLISLIFVLEHVLHPDILLKSVHQDMRKGAALYLEVPDEVCFNLKNSDDDIFNSCHLWMFGPQSLSRFLDYCGFEILCSDRIKTKRGHFALMVLASQKDREAKK